GKPVADGVVDEPGAQPHSLAKEREIEESLGGFGGMRSGGGEHGGVGVFEEAVSVRALPLLRPDHGDREGRVGDRSASSDALLAQRRIRGMLATLFLGAHLAEGLLVALARLL